jgi:predicted DCC family thiol-disulfide oxidoreductase YuxK
MNELHVWSSATGVRSGSDAVAALLKQLPMLGWAGSILSFPLVRPFARIVYRQIARNRKACDRAVAMERTKRGPDVRRPDREPLM